MVANAKHSIYNVHNYRFYDMQQKNTEEIKEGPELGWIPQCAKFRTLWYIPTEIIQRLIFLETLKASYEEIRLSLQDHQASTEINIEKLRVEVYDNRKEFDASSIIIRAQAAYGLPIKSRRIKYFQPEINRNYSKILVKTPAYLWLPSFCECEEWTDLFIRMSHSLPPLQREKLFYISLYNIV